MHCFIAGGNGNTNNFPCCYICFGPFEDCRQICEILHFSAKKEEEEEETLSYF